MTPGEIGRLAEAAWRAGVHELELDGPGTSLRLRLDRASGAPQAMVAPSAQQVSALQGARAPGVGLFRHRHPLTGRSFSEAGQRVEPGQIVGFLEVGAGLRPVTAPTGGTIGAPMFDDGALVGYGTLLYPLA